ncbi:sporulation protein YpjB [Cohnella endophytica]|uniref:sporulation protein YpjB n=1 Tax=Cohnella endophytica TaxID=2419778 RepID=UPI001314124E|nr:sporulation protein YpjB [Cohnella endophytica]
MLGFHLTLRRIVRMKVLLPGMLAMIALLCGMPRVNADSQQSTKSQAAYARFLSQAEQLYAAVNEGKLDVAMARLAALERQFRSLPMQGIATAEGIHALAQSVADMKRTSVALKPDEGKWKAGAAELRLAADELAHPDRPIWHTYRTVFLNDLATLEEAMPLSTALPGPVPESVNAAVGQLVEHYRMIRTAALLHSEPWIVEKADSSVRYATRIVQGETLTPGLLRGIVAPLREAIIGLFPGQKETSGALVPPLPMPPSWGWSAMMGSFIVTVLTWVGWRRYKVEQNTGIGPNKRREPLDEQEDAAEKLLKRWKNKK